MDIIDTHSSALTNSNDVTQDHNLALANLPPLLAQALNNTEVTEEQRQKTYNAILHLRVLEHGAYAAVPLHCKGTACSMADNCPFIKANILTMVGQQCPLEQHLMGLWLENYIESLKIDKNNIVDVSCVQEVVKIDIYEMRMNNRLAYEDVVVKQVVGIDDDGTPHYRDELHVSAQWLDVLSKRKSKILESLLATRRAIAMAGAGMDAEDPSSQASRILQTVRKANRSLQRQADNLKADSAKKAN